MKEKIKFIRVSSHSGKTHVREIEVDPDDIIKWKKGALIQTVLHYVPAPEREFLMSGITPDEWLTIFPPDKDSK
jgi:hypothetical protein